MRTQQSASTTMLYEPWTTLYVKFTPCFNLSTNIAMHVKLTIQQMNPEKRTILPSIAFRGFASRYQRPEQSDGFQDITEVGFKVCPSQQIVNIDCTDWAPCSLKEATWRESSGLDIGPNNPKNNAWAIHVNPMPFTWKRYSICWEYVTFACMHIEDRIFGYTTW
jgi:hypothetical protein